MFALLTLATGRSIHFDLDSALAEERSVVGMWGVEHVVQKPDELFEALLLASYDDVNLRQAAEVFATATEHNLPSLGVLDPWQADTLRDVVQRHFVDCYLTANDDGLVALAEAFLAQDGANVVKLVLASERWTILRGWWLCSPDDLEWAAFTPRNSDELRNRARALLGVEGRQEAAADGVPFLDDDDVEDTTRMLLIEAMGRARVATAVPKLIEILASGDPSCQKSAIRALGEIGSSAAVGALIEQWQTQGGKLTNEIVNALRGVSSGAGAVYLHPFVETNSDVALEGMLFLDDHQAPQRQLPAERLAQLLGDGRLEVRRDVISLLGALGKAEDAHIVRRVAANETDADVRVLAEKAARNLEGRNGRA